MNADWLAGGGELGALIRAHDWNKTALGPVEHWPQSLRSAVSILLPSRAQICLFWGPRLVTVYNDAYRPVLGLKHPWALGRPAAETWSEIWDGVLRPLLEGVLRTGEAFWASDHPFFLERHGYPEETYFDVSYDPVRDESGGVGGVFCIVAETSGRVVGERRLRTLSALGRISSANQSMHGVFSHAAEVLRASPEDIAFALLYEYDANTGEARLLERVGIDASHMAAASRITAQEGPWPLHARLPADGAVLDMASLAMPALPGGCWPEPCRNVAVLPIAMPSAAADGFLVAGASPRRPFDDGYRDYLRLVASGIASAAANAKALEAERRRAQALAEIDRAKTAFFSNISHEFRTPLTLLLAPLSEELERGEAADESRARLELAHRNATRLLKLVNSLLDFSRLEAGRTNARFEATNLALYTTELVSNFESTCANAGLSLRVACEPMPQAAYIDRDMWEKIVLNLVSNAFKFTFEGEIEVRLAVEGSSAVLAVRDTGVGIAPEELPRIFERFHRIEGVRARTHEGSGIGLALVQELVRMHGGTVRAESAPGKGTLFEVRIPLGDSHLPAAQVVRQARAAHSPSRDQAAMFVQEAGGWLRGGAAAGAIEGAGSRGARRERILVADDNADMREYIERLLAEWWDVVAVVDGADALRELLTGRFDLLLTDVMMPRMDGFALVQAVRSEEALRDIPVLMLSARAGEEARIEGREAGADEYLVKPFSAKELVAQVRAHLATARARRQHAREREVLLANERAARMDAERQWEDLMRLFEQAPNPIVILRGSDYMIEMANAGACRIWGRSAQQVLGKPLLEALPELRGQPFEELLQGVMTTGEPCQGRRVAATLERGNAKDTVYFDFVYSPLRSASGRIDGIAVIAHDVTAQVSGAVTAIVS